jgi:hypothetical protein
MNPSEQFYTAQRWVVPSASTPGLAYVVAVDSGTGLFTCGCLDHQHRHRDCRHIRSVQSVATVREPAPSVGSVADLYTDGGASLARSLAARS